MIEDALKFYYAAAGLKDLLRQGAIEWRVDKERKESIAEHTYGCLVLATLLQSELKIDVDMERVLKMLTFHELEELFIGDITPLDNKNKSVLTKKAEKEIAKLVKNVACKDEIVALTKEFNDCNSLEAKFAKAVDKLECVLEFKKYQDLGQVSLKNLTDEMLKNKKLKFLVDCGKYDLADIFFVYHLPAYQDFGIDEKFWFEKIKNLKIEKTA